jgi:hypothetical protein
MTIFFIIINLILNIIALLSIIILFLRQGKLFKLEDNQKRNIQEMEELLSSFVLEVKEDNEQLIKRIEEIKIEKTLSSQNKQKEPTSIKKSIEKKTEADVKEDVKEKENDLSTRLEKTVGNYAVKAYQQQLKQEKADSQAYLNDSELPKTQENVNTVYQESLASQVRNLKDQGYSLEEIAQKLKKGKTEIDLLLKFQESHQK